MGYRAGTNGSADRAYFQRTANRVKTVNIKPKIMRGGIRF